MIEVINISLAVFSIALGMFGWLAPKYTMSVVDLQRGDSTMGMSEVRAASGALFVGLGVGALFLATPAAYAMIGFAWGFASIGRLTSIVLDGATTKKWGFFACEISVGAVLIGINI
ncbi:DUF4345 family protein [Parasulfitobacter algicola]|uniref:DUF4345 family protein n=1 Tax=Parasulfitobacter algicola TaxID=2614809 RepID=A0ABX2IS34_9RHOB|nr:DUF4345 family protein [Sulfitobacter algicola]NSX55712.1 DUF4345 family protein [Sulfitobacter algicola]